MSNFYRVQVTIGNDSSLSRDAAVNVWHVKGDGGAGAVPASATDIHAAFTTFYQAIGPLLSENIDQALCRLKVYDLSQPPVRFPIFDEPMPFGGSGTGQWPNEVAICLSFRAPFNTSLSRRRIAGRIYLGPLSNNTGIDATGDMQITATTRSDITAAVAANLLPFASPTSTEDLTWCVFSRSDALGLAVGEAGPDSEPAYTDPQLEAGFKQVSTVWVDNAYDTQRRRGLRPTARTFMGA